MGELKVAPKILATSHSITLFWEKHPAASPEWSYRLLAEEMAALSTAKTHFTLDNLPPNGSVYLTLQISIGGNPWHTIWQGICHTLLSKHRIVNVRLLKFADLIYWGMRCGMYRSTNAFSGKSLHRHSEKPGDPH